MRKLALSLVTVGLFVGGACTSPAPSGGKTDPEGMEEETGGSTGTGGKAAGTGGSKATGGSTGTGGSATGGSTGTGGATGGSSGGNADAGPVSPPPADAGPPVVSEPNAPCPRCVRIFTGMNFDGWEAAPATWKIVEGGAMHGQGGTSRAAYTKKDYGNVRLIVTSRLNPANGDHLGILFWGNRPMDPNKPQIDNAGWVQWMPPFGGMWSYHPPMHHGLKAMKLADSPSPGTTWHTSELLLNLDKGTLRVAVNGIETTRYTHAWPTERVDPTKRIIKGPLAMMKHGSGGSEYKDIWVEDEPTEDKLYTIK
jgi:hypothetical protein